LKFFINHCCVGQENAELLTEEGRLLQAIQGDDVVDYDIDAYAQRLQEILGECMLNEEGKCGAVDSFECCACNRATLAR
jgi:hypothetical protein